MALPFRQTGARDEAQTLYARRPAPTLPPSPKRKAALGLVVAVVLLSLGARLHGSVGEISYWLRLITVVALMVLVLPGLYRNLRSNVLWSLRNKLALTYLLIGLSPILLFFTLVCLSSWVAAGQFAIHLASTRLTAQLDELAMENAASSHHLARLLREGVDPANLVLPELEQRESDARDPAVGALHRQTAAFLDGRPLTLQRLIGSARSPLGQPDWFFHGSSSAVRTLAVDGRSIYLVAVNRRDAGNGRTVTMISSILIDHTLMTLIAEGLGRASLVPALTDEDGPNSGGQLQTRRGQPVSNKEVRASQIIGGTYPVAVNIADVRVRFFSTVGLLQWDSGLEASVPLQVESRPSLLYRQLFGANLSGRLTTFLRLIFLVICIVFALIEALALYLAMRLSRTITQSVEDLYSATLSIDQGDLSRRISVQRSDQLADLSHSFNRMTWSMQRLLEEQKEKERMQNELSIAQEVQENLFPQASVQVPSLELHGVCKPARSVSGDYYDFLVFNAGSTLSSVSGVGIALGDISGKGISAALLMATLHSAVRAYRFASEELVFSENALAALMAMRGDQAANDCGEIFESPGRILSLLNRHLYRSTQPEKYATLFLAHYDVASAKLTYSNAGQLPPFILRRDGTLLRLDKGGTVVGLMDGMRYDEDCIDLVAGDILIAYSDGVTEPENDFGDFGEERLIDVVRQYRHESLDVISAEVLRALAAWIGDEEQPDDITLVLARQQ